MRIEIDYSEQSNYIGAIVVRFTKEIASNINASFEIELTTVNSLIPKDIFLDQLEHLAQLLPASPFKRVYSELAKHLDKTPCSC
jgi:hypothetical protein